jgi:hypothetical protein
LYVIGWDHSNTTTPSGNEEGKDGSTKGLKEQRGQRRKHQGLKEELQEDSQDFIQSC